jgi:hypothetical protein
MDRVLRPATLLVLVALLVGAPAAHAAICTSSEKTSAQAALAAYTKHMGAQRSAYFKTHGSPKARAAFAAAQTKTLARLRAAAGCDDSSGGSLLPQPQPAPAPAANEHFAFSDEIPQSARTLVQEDVAYAAQDEQQLIGAQLNEVNVFVSTKPEWLAQQECGFWGYDASCVAMKTVDWAAGPAAEGGDRADFLNWASGQFNGSDAPGAQKTIAHELFHTFQYQLDGLLSDGSVPFDQVRHAGPVWMQEGAAEMIGYRVLGDRHLGYTTYPNLLLTEKFRAKSSNVPLDELQTVAQDRANGNPYALYMVAVDHLVTEAPSGLHALTTYYTALAGGLAWPDAFQQAFGLSVPAFYADFAAYRSKL